MTDDKQMYFTILLEEYRTLRDESRQASINMLTAFRWGGAAIGAAVGVGFLAWYHKLHLAVLFIFFLLIPVVGALSMFLWLGEAIRFKRVGDFLALIEKKVALLFTDFRTTSSFAVEWEKRVRRIEEDLNLPHVLPLTDPLNWEQWPRATGAQSNIFKLEGHQALAYLLRLISFPIFMVISFTIGIYYVIAHPRLTPSFLKFTQDYVIDERQGSAVIIILSLVVIIIAGIIGGFIALKLQAKTHLTTEEQQFEEESIEGNGA